LTCLLEIRIDLPSGTIALSLAVEMPKPDTARPYLGKAPFACAGRSLTNRSPPCINPTPPRRGGVPFRCREILRREYRQAAADERLPAREQGKAV
jgi:hypothetical protein